MPFIHVQTNTAITDEQAKNIKTHLGLAITAVPGKTENWLMVGLEPECHLWFKLFFQGTDAPAAMVEVQLYGKASSNALNTLTSNITGILLDTLKIPTDRIYVSYMCTENWGWNSSNF